MRIEASSHSERTYPFRLERILGRTYDHFRRDEAINYGAVYSGIELASNVQVGLNGTNPLIAAFELSLRESVSSSERAHFEATSDVLLDPFQSFEGRDVLSVIPAWLKHNPQDGEFARLMNLPMLQEAGKAAAGEKSKGLFYEHLAGAIELDGDSEPVGFSDENAGFFRLLAADFLHNRGRELILRFMRDSRLIDPPPARFDRDYEAIERFREEERGRWGVVAALDLVAMEAWQRYLESGAPGGRIRRATLAVEKYSKSISAIERLRDISALEARGTLNPFQAL